MNAFFKYRQDNNNSFVLSMVHWALNINYLSIYHLVDVKKRSRLTSCVFREIHIKGFAIDNRLLLSLKALSAIGTLIASFVDRLLFRHGYSCQ